MDHIYLIVSSDKVTLDNQVEEIKKKNKEIEVIFYDLEEIPIEQVIEDLDTYNFLSSKKLVVAKNALFLSSEKRKGGVEHNLEKLEKYMEHPSLENILILVADTIDKRKKITSLVAKRAKVIEELSDIHSVIKRHLEDYVMDSVSEKKLLEYCQNDHERVLNELEKLKLYKLEQKKITEQDIEDIVRESLDHNIFHLADAILSKNKKEAFRLYQDFLLHGEEIVSMIRVVASKIRLIYQVKVLLNDGNSDQMVSKLLKVHEYPVKLAREASYRYTERVLLDDLGKLANLDLQIKSGESLGEVEFEMLLATI